MMGQKKSLSNPMIPSGNQAWQWTIPQKLDDFLSSKRPFSTQILHFKSMDCGANPWKL
jgi:hypothetical protein